jgi:pilus assembly protein FimV
LELGDAELSSTELSLEGDNADLLASSESDIDLSEFSLSDESELTDELNIDTPSVTDKSDAASENNDNQLDDFDFDFDFSVEGDASYTPAVAVEEGDAGHELTLGDDDQKLTLDSDMIAEINETGDYETNLDLAKMYVAMGETDAAKELAEDVLANGSDEQKKEAQEVLDHMSS